MFSKCKTSAKAQYLLITALHTQKQENNIFSLEHKASTSLPGSTALAVIRWSRVPETLISNEKRTFITINSLKL